MLSKTRLWKRFSRRSSQTGSTGLSSGAYGGRLGSRMLARAGADRDRGIDEAIVELMRRCGLASLRGFSADQREAWRRMAPILTLLDLGAWRGDKCRALVDLSRAKGGRSERNYVARYLTLPTLEAALLQRARARGR